MLRGGESEEVGGSRSSVAEVFDTGRGVVELKLVEDMSRRGAIFLPFVDDFGACLMYACLVKDSDAPGEGRRVGCRIGTAPYLQMHSGSATICTRKGTLSIAASMPGNPRRSSATPWSYRRNSSIRSSVRTCGRCATWLNHISRIRSSRCRAHVSMKSNNLVDSGQLWRGGKEDRACAVKLRNLLEGISSFGKQDLRTVRSGGCDRKRHDEG